MLWRLSLKNQLSLITYLEFGKNNRTLLPSIFAFGSSFQNWAPGKSLLNKKLKFIPGNPCIWWWWWRRCLLCFLDSSECGDGHQLYICRYFMCVVGWDEKQASEWEEDFHLHLHMHIHVHHMWDWDLDLRLHSAPPSSSSSSSSSVVVGIWSNWQCESLALHCIGGDWFRVGSQRKVK